MADVVDISAARRNSPEAALRCERCGGEWFVLHAVGAGTRPAQVTMTRAGRVTGYHGLPSCAECGRSAPLT
jgi:hypothetical protein